MPTRFFNVSKGSFTEMIKNNKYTYDSVSGSVDGIALKTHRRKDGETFQRWHLKMSDKATGQKYDISLSRTSNVMISLIRSLASDEGLKNLQSVKICTSAGKISAFTNVRVIAGGHSLKWIEGKVPEVQCYRVEGKVVSNDEDRFLWISGLVSQVNKQVQVQAATGDWKPSAPEGEKTFSKYSKGPKYPYYKPAAVRREMRYGI